MSAAGDSGRLSGFPNVFYDLIVFVTPSLTAALGVAFGATGTGWLHHLHLADVAVLNAIGFAVVALFLSYEYGRVAEAWSALLVQRPLKYLNRHVRWLRNEDFCCDHVDLYDYLSLRKPADGRSGDKWVLYIFDALVSPAIGSDLLKRYAWEKLARSSAFTYVVLLLTSLLFAVLASISLVGLPAGSIGFGGVWYTLAVAALALVATVDYFKRNAWNHDLLTRTAPVLIEARRLTEARLSAVSSSTQ